MVDDDGMTIDVGKLIGRKVELSRYDAALPVHAQRHIAVDRQRVRFVLGRELCTPGMTAIVVKGREDRHDTELTCVEVMSRYFVVAVDGNAQIVGRLTDHTRVPFE